MPLELAPLLKDRLAGAARVAIMGIGSELRADDAAGMLVAERCEKTPAANMKVFFGCTAPENITGEIRKFCPTHLVIIDAADTGAEPGTISFIDPAQIAGISFSTHMMPLNILISFITADTHCVPLIIGIQPQTLAFGEPVSPAVTAAVTELADALTATIAAL